MVAKLKLQGIDGRAPQGVEPAAGFDSTQGEKSPIRSWWSDHCSNSPTTLSGPHARYTEGLCMAFSWPEGLGKLLTPLHECGIPRKRES